MGWKHPLGQQNSVVVWNVEMCNIWNLQKVIQHTEVSAMFKAFFYVDSRQYKNIEENVSFLTNFMEGNLPLESRIPSAFNFNSAKIYTIALHTTENKQQVFPFIRKYQKLSDFISIFSQDSLIITR
jgi:hypothetical protein